METFGGLHKSTADKYCFESLEKDTEQFRLLQLLPSSSVLQLHFSLQTFNRAEAPVYKALSYTWGSADSNEQGNGRSIISRIILLNGKEFGIFENLHNALLELWHQVNLHGSLVSPSTHYWIDAICVDQKNDIERGHQVNLMDAIYTNATGVIVWLGSEKESHNAFSRDLVKKTSALGAILVRDAKMAATTGWIVWHESDEKRAEYCSRVGVPAFTDIAWLYLLELFSRQWFSRLWVVQEVALAREVHVLCGGSQFSWNDIEMTAEAFATGLGSDISKAHLSPQARHHFSSSNTCLLHICRIRSWCQTNTYPPGFEEYSILTGGVADTRPYAPAVLLVVLRFFQVTDGRDKIFGILGLVRALLGNNESFISADYTQSSIEVQRAASQKILQQTGWLGFIHFARNQTKGDHDDDNNDETTSWIIGSSPIRDAYFEKRFDAVRAVSSKDWTTQPGFLFLDSRCIRTSGVKICTVTAVGEPLRDFYDMSIPFTKTTEMILALEPTYRFTGQNRIEASAEAMIESLLTGPALITAFRDWWLYMLANNSHISNLKHPRRLLEEMTACNGSKSVNKTTDEREEQPNNSIPGELHEESKVYGEHFYLISFRRRFYTSSEGFIGVALEALQPGDEIWLLPRTCSPFAIRRVPDKGAGNSYSLVGPAFTLGAMYGEIVTEGSLWKEIILK
ncbi:hypothetical protein BP5796_09812 [Coleophoma crateriformis]|uniref:Heterokaryon incompatibility domain-containing protein n=1 Tax=Coleophoma crateriformis TaxID=565419 RepID=A0A3D8QZ11_9HELO|nr:hypothetical protein BP5796_09812 [Coleophoma crateriformis]